MLLRLLIVTVGFAVLSSSIWAQTPPKKSSPDESRPGVFDALKVGDMAQAARDFRSGSEALERFGRLLEGIIDRIAGAIETASEHHAEMSAAFDPFGFKTAFQTIQEQSETIRELQQDEIRRLRKELKRGDSGSKKRFRRGNARAGRSSNKL